MMDFIRRIVMYLGYKLLSGHRKGHGIHSPFLFSFITEVLNDKKIYDEYIQIEALYREKAKRTKLILEVHDYGAASKTFFNNTRLFSELLNRSSVSRKYGRLLHRIVKYYRPDSIIELGTSIGFSTQYMARANPLCQLTTIEGNDTLINVAKDCASQLGNSNITFVQMHFEEYINKSSINGQKWDMVFIDGHHQYAATMKYFENFIHKVTGGVIILDDINWSGDMLKAWKEICRHPKAIVTINLYRMGIVFTSDEITPGNYMIRF